MTYHRFVDSHCHIDLVAQQSQQSIDTIVQQAFAAGVERMICVNIDLKQFQPMAAALAPWPQVAITAGQHPCDVANPSWDGDQLLTLAQNPRVVAIGETGLDYYHDSSTKHLQNEVFEQHIAVAQQVNKPLVIHMREAAPDTLAQLKRARNGGCEAIMHCFTDTLDTAKAALDLGCYISFSGIITFKNAAALREVVSYVPLDRMLIETDSPYLAPVPYRGKVNFPAYVVEVAAMVAQLKRCDLAEVAEVTYKNSTQLFPTWLNQIK